jgi:hypothetical protein
MKSEQRIHAVEPLVARAGFLPQVNNGVPAPLQLQRVETSQIMRRAFYM